MATRRQLAAYLAPGAALVTVFFVVPLVFVLWMSFRSWVGVGPADFVGLGNFSTLAHDPSFRTALRNTLVWVAVGVFVHTPLCILLAVVLARRPRLWKVFRTIFFLPNVISATALALLWYFLLNVRLGLVNRGLSAIGLESWGHAWLSDPKTSLVSTILPWTIYIGFGMVLFLTQISTIPEELYEAAELDGAGPVRQDWSITVPLIRRAIALQVLFVVGYALRTFEYPFVMTNGGPADSSNTLSLYIYRQMVTANQYGLSMAAGLVTLVVGVVLTVLVFLGLRRAER